MSGGRDGREGYISFLSFPFFIEMSVYFFLKRHHILTQVAVSKE